MTDRLETRAVLCAELAAISPLSAQPDAANADEPVEPFLLDANLAALCLSGGGIRSASFALGVIQALASYAVKLTPTVTSSAPSPTAEAIAADSAESSLLSRFHFLSTVSGGGYIGSFLSTWIARTDYAKVVWPNLIGRPKGSGVEPAPIAWLRDYSSYLTPRVGLASADTWTAVALFVRNMALNWFVLVPILLLGILLIDAGVFAVIWLGATPPTAMPLAAFFAIGGIVALVSACRFITRHRPTRSRMSESVTFWRAATARIRWFAVDPRLGHTGLRHLSVRTSLDATSFMERLPCLYRPWMDCGRSVIWNRLGVGLLPIAGRKRTYRQVVRLHQMARCGCGVGKFRVPG